RPMSPIGCATVVSGGSEYRANRMSSKPTTDTSCGTRSPCDLMARRAPTAISSLEQNTAGKLSPRANSDSMAQGQQIFCGLLRRGDIVDVDAGDRSVPDVLAGIDDRQSSGRADLRNMRQQRDEAVGLPRVEQIGVALLPGAVVLGVAQQDRVVAAVRHLFDAANDLREEWI